MNDMTEELLIKYLLNEVDVDERLRIETWMSESPENASEFRRIEAIWQSAASLSEKSDVNTDAAWNRFQKLASSRTAKAKIRPFTKRFDWIRIAAVLFIVAGGWTFFQIFSDNYERIEAGDRVISQTLPDGSEITLNKRSLVEYQAEFAGTTRNVRLIEGEAFFNVKQDKSKPFIVKVNDIKVQVLGTSFNIRSDHDLTEVIVESGLVRVGRGSQQIELSQGERILVRAGSGKFVKTRNPDRLHRYYRENVIEADDTPLWRLVEILNQAYDTQVEIANPAIRNLRLTTTFRNEPLDQVVLVITETLKINSVHENGKIILR